MKIYKICQLDRNKTINNLDLTLEEIHEIINIDNTEVILEDSEDVTIGLFSDKTITFIKDLFDKYNVEYTVEDITNRYIRTSSLFDKFLKDYSEHKDEIIENIIQTTTVNDILDKINVFGVESLNELDKEILKNNKI